MPRNSDSFSFIPRRSFRDEIAKMGFADTSPTRLFQLAALRCQTNDSARHAADRLTGTGR